MLIRIYLYVGSNDGVGRQWAIQRMNIGITDILFENSRQILSVETKRKIVHKTYFTIVGSIEISTVVESGKALTESHITHKIDISGTCNRGVYIFQGIRAAFYLHIACKCE